MGSGAHRSVTMLLFVCAAVVSTAATDGEPVSRWNVQSEVPSDGDGKNVYLSLNADPEPGGWSESFTPALIIRCLTGKVEAYVVAGVPAEEESGHNYVTVTLRLDDQEATSEKMSPSEDRTALFFWQAEEFVGKLVRHREMSLQFTPAKSTPVTAHFQLSGLKEELNSVEPGCLKSPPLDPTKGPLLAGVNGISNPILIESTKVDPTYPAKARSKKINGQVILQAVIKRDGSVGDIEVIRVNRPDYGFEEASIEAVRQWRYEPGLYDGKPVDVYFTVVFDFSLR